MEQSGKLIASIRIGKLNSTHPPCQSQIQQTFNMHHKAYHLPLKRDFAIGSGGITPRIIVQQLGRVLMSSTLGGKYTVIHQPCTANQ